MSTGRKPAKRKLSDEKPDKVYDFHEEVGTKENSGSEDEIREGECYLTQSVLTSFYSREGVCDFFFHVNFLKLTSRHFQSVLTLWCKL